MVRQIQKNPPKKVKERFSDGVGIICIKVSFNNIIVTVTDLEGKVVYWLSAGRCGWKGTRKRTAHAGKVVTETAIQHCVEQYKLKRATVLIKGCGAGRDNAVKYAVKARKKFRLNVTLVRDITGLPHNGCRPPNKRRT